MEQELAVAVLMEQELAVAVLMEQELAGAVLVGHVAVGSDKPAWFHSLAEVAYEPDCWRNYL